MKRFFTGTLAGAATVALLVGCADQVRQLEPKLELKRAAESLGATGRAGFTIRAGGSVDDLIAQARKTSGRGDKAFTDEDAATVRKIYNSSVTIAWDRAGAGVADDRTMVTATIDGVAGTEVRMVDGVTYAKAPVDKLAARFGASAADVDALRRQQGSGIGGVDTLLDGGWVSIAAADLSRLREGLPEAAASADPQRNDAFLAELKTSAQKLLDGAEVLRDGRDRTHLTVKTSTVQAYEQGRHLVESMRKAAGSSASTLLDDAVGSELDKAPKDRPIVVDLWVDNGTFKAFEINLLQFVDGSTGRATLRAEVSTGTDITAPGGATRLDLSKAFPTGPTAGAGTGSSSGAGISSGAGSGGASTWAELVGSQAVLLALTEGGKPAAHLKKAAADVSMPGVTVKIVRRGVAQVSSADSVACVTVPATTAGKPKVVTHAC